jgi:abortive infection bacteriophage resistance protein
MSSSRRPFSKPVLSLPEQLSLLQQRGLTITDPQKALHYLEYIGYYRLSGYTRPFQSGEDHSFKTGTTFDDILSLYVFDRKLRLLLLDAIERLEVALRSVVNNTLSDALGAHWYLNPQAYQLPAGEDFQAFLGHLREEMGYSGNRRLETFISHYRETYSSPEDPPGWMMVQTLSMGTLSRLYARLLLPYQKTIATKFGLDHKILTSVLHSLSHLRNLCAHHSRVWNRELRIKPRLPHVVRATYSGPPDRIGALVCILSFLLEKISPDTQWQGHFDALLAEHPSVHRRSMGFLES